jgi:hypothetical protein
MLSLDYLKKISGRLSVISFILAIIAWLLTGLYFKIPSIIYLCWFIWIISFVLGILGWKRTSKKAGLIYRVSASIAPVLAVILCFSMTYMIIDLFIIDYSYCRHKITRLGDGIKFYCSEHNGEFPQVTNWCNLLLSDSNRPFTIPKEAFNCPDIKGDFSGYAMNNNLGGKTWNEVDPNTVILFECIPGWNQNGGPELIRFNKHSFPFGMRKVNVICKGSDTLKFMTINRRQISNLRWKP